MNKLLTSSEKTSQWLNKIIAIIKEKIPTVVYKKSKYWVSLKSSYTKKNFVNLQTRKNHIVLLTTLNDNYSNDLKSATSSGSWKKEFPSKFLIKSEKDIEKAVELIIASYEEIRKQQGGYTKIEPEGPEEISNPKGKYSGGEGKDHERLKKWIAGNAWFIGLENVSKVEIESHTFPSGDLPDLVFHYNRNKYTVVEIETDNPLPGAYQALKYKYLLITELWLPLSSVNVKSVLVAWTIPPNVQKFCEKYSIDYVEKKI